MGDKKGAWIQKLKEGKGNLWMTCLLLGLLFLVITIPTDQKSSEIEERNTAGDSVENGIDVSSGLQDSAELLERRLERVLREVEGVGEVEVMLTFRSSGEKIVEKDVRSSSGESEQSQTDQGSSASSSEQEEATVYERLENGTDIPYVKEVREPQVEGVVVAAEGGGNSVIAANITDAVMALFGIEAHKIKVMKKK